MFRPFLLGVLLALTRCAPDDAAVVSLSDEELKRAELARPSCSQGLSCAQILKRGRQSPGAQVCVATSEFEAGLVGMDVCNLSVTDPSFSFDVLARVEERVRPVLKERCPDCELHSIDAFKRPMLRACFRFEEQPEPNAERWPVRIETSDCRPNLEYDDVYLRTWWHGRPLSFALRLLGSVTTDEEWRALYSRLPYDGLQRKGWRLLPRY